MIQIFRKREKSIEDPQGCEELTDFENYDRPFMMCLSSQDLIDNSVFGLIKEGARAARVRTTDELAAGFKIDKMPFDFLGLKYIPDKVKNQRESKLVNDFIYPFLKKGNDIKKQARKINFFTFCDATNRYIEIERQLKELLRSDGYSEEDIKDILSQISVVAIASNAKIADLYATTFLFKDINDSEVYDRVSKICANKLPVKRNTMIYQLSNTVRVFAFNGTGDHSLREYLNDGSIAKPSLCAIVSYLVENSILNSKSDELVPINGKILSSRALKYNADFDSIEESLDNLDISLDYDGTPRYTKGEHAILLELDKVCKKYVASKKTTERQEKEIQDLQDNKRTLISGIRENCSEVAFANIVVKNKMYNPSKKDLEILSRQLPTDKEVRQMWELSRTYTPNHELDDGPKL